MVDEVEVNNDVLDGIKGEETVVCIVTATKPDFYKQWSLLPAAEKLKVPVIVINTGQHHDNLLGFGLEEFDIKKYIGFNLNIRGDLLSKSYEIIAKTGFAARTLKDLSPKTTFIPVVHGDTLAAGIFPIGWMFATGKKVAQNEAGLRGMAPKFSKNVEAFIENQWENKWELSRQEPFPEQWDTFVAGASSELHFAPLQVNKDHLVREGTPRDRVFVVGNSIVDAMEHTKRMKPEISIFEEYPVLDEFDNWLRVDIHRRANLSEDRFKAVFLGVRDLIKDRQPVAWVELSGTRFALEKYGLRDEIIKLSKSYDNFLFTPLWKSYSSVMEFFRSGKCAAVLTDSGSLQEELNHLGLPALTVRYNTYRPETVNEAKSNLLVPPHKGLVYDMTHYVLNRPDLLESMGHGKKLYGEDVGIKIMQKIKELGNGDLNMNRTVPEVLGLKNGSKIDFL